MHWRGNGQLWSVEFHFCVFSAMWPSAPFEVLSPPDFECRMQKSSSAFQWLPHKFCVLDISYHSFHFHFRVKIVRSWKHVCWLEVVVCVCVKTKCRWSITVVRTQELSESHSGCLLFLYGSWLLIVIFPLDCNCWSWLSVVDCRPTVVGTEETGQVGRATTTTARVWDVIS